MTNPYELTHEDCILLLDWLEEVIGFNLPSFDLYQRMRMGDELLEGFLANDSIPEKIRRALAERGIVADFTIWEEVSDLAPGDNPDIGRVYLKKKINGFWCIGKLAYVDWDLIKDPTGKHALIQATLEYIKGERDG